MKISAVITALNEEEKIKLCFESVTWADEIIVVDDGSTDKTIDIAKKYTKKIYRHTSKGYVEPARNFAIQKASGDWILLLDADEQIPDTLSLRLREIAERDSAEYVWVPRKNIIFREWIQHSGWWPDYHVRFFKKGTVSWTNKIHSKPELSGRELVLEAKEDYAIVHANYETVSQFLQKMDRYTNIGAQELIGDNASFSHRNLLTKPTEEFLSRFFAREGYRDGYHGLLLASLEAFSAQIVAAKIWEREGFMEETSSHFLTNIKREFRKVGLKIEYWLLTSIISSLTNPLQKIPLRLKRKGIAKKLRHE